MTEKEMLELAAKAAGLTPTGEVWMGGLVCAWDGRTEGLTLKQQIVENGDKLRVTHTFVWNPLNDDSDALRLAVKLKIDLMFSREILPVHAHHTVTAWSDLRTRADEFLRSDERAAVRRAIVRAAAEIGKTVP